MVIDALHHTVYLPFRVALSKHLDKALASAIGIKTSFLVTKLMHKLIFYYMTRVRPTWGVTWFFACMGFVWLGRLL